MPVAGGYLAVEIIKFKESITRIIHVNEKNNSQDTNKPQYMLF